MGLLWRGRVGAPSSRTRGDAVLASTEASVTDALFWILHGVAWMELATMLLGHGCPWRDPDAEEDFALDVLLWLLENSDGGLSPESAAKLRATKPERTHLRVVK